jgi:hypothetical protein
MQAGRSKVRPLQRSPRRLYRSFPLARPPCFSSSIFPVSGLLR